jgi:hypothetical protein
MEKKGEALKAQRSKTAANTKEAEKLLEQELEAAMTIDAYTVLRDSVKKP